MGKGSSGQKKPRETATRRHKTHKRGIRSGRFCFCVFCTLSWPSLPAPHPVEQLWPWWARRIIGKGFPRNERPAGLMRAFSIVPLIQMLNVKRNVLTLLTFAFGAGGLLAADPSTAEDA